MTLTLDAVGAPRVGLLYWLSGFRTMLRWQLASLRLWAPTAAAVEALSGIGMVMGFGLLVPHLTIRAALFLTTGSAVVSMVLIGLIMGTQLVAQQKNERTYEYLLSLPVPRSAAALSWYAVVVIVGVPGALATLAVGAWRFGLSFSASPSIVAAVLITIFTATMLGYAVAHAISKPMVTIILSQVFIFLAFGFAPINFPPDQMPHWLAEANRWLPFLPMANVVRSGLTHGLATHVAQSYCVLTAWAAGSSGLAFLALGRRR